jgi:peptide chain release factor 1
MFDKLERINEKYEQLTEMIGDSQVIADQERWRGLMKEHAELEPVVEKFREYRAAEEHFHSMRRYLNITVCHDSLLMIESSFAELIGAAEAKDEESLIITKSRLIGEISHLRRLSGINMNSIF